MFGNEDQHLSLSFQATKINIHGGLFFHLCFYSYSILCGNDFAVVLPEFGLYPLADEFDLLLFANSLFMFLESIFESIGVNLYMQL